MINATTLFLMLTETYDVSPTQAAVMTCLAYEESKFNTQAVNHSNRNGTKDYGLFQINSIWLSECGSTRQELLDLHTNIKCANLVYNKQGVTAWVTHKKCT